MFRRVLLTLPLALCLGAPAQATVPHLPEVREILDPIHVKVNAGHGDDLRLGAQLALEREGRVVAYGRVSSLGEDWAVLDIEVQRPDTFLQLGDALRPLGWQPTLPLGLNRPLLEKSEPRHRAVLDALLATDVDHGLETDPPMPLTHWTAPPAPAWELPAGETSPPHLSAPAKAAPQPRAIAPPQDVSWVFTLDYLTLAQLQKAVDELGYGQRVRLSAHQSTYPEDQGKTLVRVEALGEDLLATVARLIRRLDVLPGNPR